jgi:hypothetical protein
MDSKCPGGDLARRVPKPEAQPVMGGLWMKHEPAGFEKNLGIPCKLGFFCVDSFEISIRQVSACKYVT